MLRALRRFGAIVAVVGIFCTPGAAVAAGTPAHDDPPGTVVIGNNNQVAGRDIINIFVRDNVVGDGNVTGTGHNVGLGDDDDPPTAVGCFHIDNQSGQTLTLTDVDADPATLWVLPDDQPAQTIDDGSTTPSCGYTTSPTGPMSWRISLTYSIGNTGDKATFTFTSGDDQASGNVTFDPTDAPYQGQLISASSENDISVVMLRILPAS